MNKFSKLLIEYLYKCLMGKLKFKKIKFIKKEFLILNLNHQINVIKIEN